MTGVFLLLSLLLFAGCAGEPKVTLRKFPYPYKAALSICSDLDQIGSMEEFISIQTFLNDTVMTEYGRGLGLEVGSSYWYYNQWAQLSKSPSPPDDSVTTAFLAAPDSGISIFSGLSDTLNPYADTLLAYIKSGYLDCLHTYGHLNYGGFKRALVARALDVHGGELPVDVFINHEGPCNEQNIGHAPGFIGDDPGSVAYHTDLTIDAGIKFLWQGHLTHCIGQDGRTTFFNTLKLIVEFFQDVIDADHSYPNDNQLVHEYKLGDGQMVFEFVRYINPWGKYSRADENYLAYQIGPDQVDELLENEGYLVQYTHLGKHASERLFSDPTIAALRYIAERQHDGDLLVATTSRLLNYNVHHKYLHWHFDETDDSVHIVIDSIANAVEGSFVPSEGDIPGLTFYVPDSRTATLSLGGGRITPVRNPADHTGKMSVSVPWPQLEPPY